MWERVWALSRGRYTKDFREAALRPLKVMTPVTELVRL